MASALLRLILGYVVEGPAFQRVRQAQNMKGVIYVYRMYPTLGYGAAVSVRVSCGDNSILLGPGGYHAFKI